ncbi:MULTISPECIES: LysR family transcriptional regulator [unclassified Roseitalea]|uniref:LysR family transcriptional regulator n=1 Tax=unclassified Roseitalea TaxID=2639107 RepID=UPI00273D7580|nr:MULTISPECIES: LysR family transcriptional regulator [unclassified Roseitalea]
MDSHGFDWNLTKSFLAVIDAGTLSGAARATGISQPTLGRHMDELEALTGLVLFERGRAGMMPTSDALLLADRARDMRAGADAFAMAATGRERTVAGPIRITASDIVSTYILPAILVRLASAEPDLEIELVPSNSVQNLLARDADIAVRMVRPVQNELIVRKVGDLAMGAFCHPDYLGARRPPATIDELKTHRLVGYDRADLIERGMKRLGVWAPRSSFRFRTDDQVAYWELVRAGAGIGFGPLFVAGRTPDLVRVMPDLAIDPLPVWLASHRELRHSAKVRRVYDFLAEALSSLPLERDEMEGSAMASSPTAATMTPQPEKTSASDHASAIMPTKAGANKRPA